MTAAPNIVAPALDRPAAGIVDQDRVLAPVVAVLFARRDSVYKTLPGTDVYDADRDARTYDGDGPSLCHPPPAVHGGECASLLTSKLGSGSMVHGRSRWCEKTAAFSNTPRKARCSLTADCLDLAGSRMRGADGLYGSNSTTSGTARRRRRGSTSLARTRCQRCRAAKGSQRTASALRALTRASHQSPNQSGNTPRSLSLNGS